MTNYFGRSESTYFMQKEETLGHKDWFTKNNLKHNLRLKQKSPLAEVQSMAD